MKKMRKKSGGQTIVEYILIITLVAIASLVVLGLFSDRVRTLIAGAASSLGSDDAADAVDTKAIEILQNMEADGVSSEE